MNHLQNKPPAVVIDLDCFTGLQTIRILSERNVPVIGVASDPGHYCVKTKMCKTKIFVDTKSDALIDKLENLGPSLPEKAVLFPCADSSVLLISKHRERLAKWYHIALPKHETVARLMDKMTFIEFAEKEGLAIPQVYFLHSREAAEEAATNLIYPCILKPTLKSKIWEANSKYKAFKVFDAEELLRLYDRYACWTEVLMAQRFIQGTDADHYTCNCYFDKTSQPLVSFVSRKLRQWPPTTGTACLSQEWRNDVVLNATIDLFQRTGFYGLGYLEMKQDAMDGKHYIIEPNIGRPTGRSALAEASGVELLYTQYCHLTGQPLPENRQQKYNNMKWIYFRRDVQSSLKYWKQGDLTLVQWLKSVRGKKVDALFSWKDPKPFVGDLIRAMKQAISGNKTKHTPESVAQQKSTADSSQLSAISDQPSKRGYHESPASF
ncbi:MAG: carboxylate--amine ligase [bacterium]